MSGETRVNLSRARELLAEQGDIVGQSSLSRYVTKYADDLEPQRDGRELTIDFERLAQHRRENITPATTAAPSSSPSTTSTSISKGRAHEASLNIRAQRQIRELELASRLGELTPTREVRAAAAEAMSALRNSFALALNDTASVIANVCGVEPRVVRPHLKAFEKSGLDAFARALAVAELEPVDDA